MNSRLRGVRGATASALGGTKSATSPIEDSSEGSECVLLRFFGETPTTYCSVHIMAMHGHIGSNSLSRETLLQYGLCAASRPPRSFRKISKSLHYSRSDAGGRNGPLTRLRLARSNGLPQAVVVVAQQTPQPLVESVWIRDLGSGDEKGISLGSAGRLDARQAAKKRANLWEGSCRAGLGRLAIGLFCLLA